MNTLSKSPKRNSFQKEKYLERQAEKGKTPENDEDTQAMVDYYDSWEIDSIKQEADPEWQKNNLEWDLRTTDWILKKVRDIDHYAQNLYAAMCNNEFQKIDTWQILTDATWTCSWRYAGGIIADMQQQGDYIDWYCSGIRGGWTDEDYANASEEERGRYHYMQDHYVSEGVVTDEISRDLKKLGWLVVTDEEDFK